MNGVPANVRAQWKQEYEDKVARYCQTQINGTFHCRIFIGNPGANTGFSATGAGYQFSKSYGGMRYRIRAQVRSCLRVSSARAEHRHDRKSPVSYNAVCLNPLHVVYEPLAENKARNGCPGLPACLHQPQCLRPGPQSGPSVNFHAYVPSGQVNTLVL